MRILIFGVLLLTACASTAQGSTPTVTPVAKSEETATLTGELAEEPTSTETAETLATSTPAPATNTPTVGATPTATVVMQQSTWDPGVFHAGLSVFETGTDEVSVERLREALDHYTSMGANTFVYVYHLVQEEYQASCVGPENSDWKERLQLFTREANLRGVNVVARPLLSEKNLGEGKWRGNIEPADIDAWFSCYLDHMMQLATLSESIGVDGLVVGSEFNSLENESLRWAQLILSLREVFSGELTYATNWDVFIHPDHPFRQSIDVGGQSVTVDSLLDYSGLDFYFRNDIDELTLENLSASWEEWLAPLTESGVDLRRVMVVEFGICARKGSYTVPYGCDHHQPIDEDEQELYYCSFFKRYGGEFRGVWVWLFTAYLPEEGDHVEPFSPFGYQAEHVIRSYFSDGKVTTC